MERYKKLVLLHSNDMHGAFLPEEKDGVPTGGVAMLSGYLNRVREEEQNVLYCIAGDMFRGSVIDSEYRGVSTIEIMNMLSPDVVTLGNHETDYGLSHLLFLEKCARFPIINANLHVKSNGARLFRPHVVVEVDGMKILFIGILTEDVIAETKKDPLIGSLVDVADAVREIGRVCDAYRTADVDLTVLLTHIGFEEDKKLAEKLDPAWSVDLIVGGHSHTLTEAPVRINNALIVQAGCGTDHIGRFDLTVDTQTNTVANFTWQAVPVTPDLCPVDREIEAVINGYKDLTDQKYGRVVTRFNRRLTHPGRTMQTRLGNLFADALKESLGVDIMLLASGSVRVEALGPIVLLSDLLEAFPFDDAAWMLRVNGYQLRQMLLYMLRDEVFTGVHCEFYQFSAGLKATYVREQRAFSSLTFLGAPVEDDRVYTLALQAYHYHNFEDAFHVSLDDVKLNGSPRMIATSCRDVLEEYLTNHPHPDKKVRERLTIV